jgi:catechol 2,3-dioxygenase-like lactoylglutathione lyase family enzyme
MSQDIDGLHHIGHLVRDLPAAVDTYRRLGFTVPPPTYPAVPAGPGRPPRTLGAANAHVRLGRSFIELVSIPDEQQPIPAGALVVPVNAPEAKLSALVAAVRDTVASLAARLDRFEGMHILMFDAPDLDRAAARLDLARVGHGGVHTAQRPVETPGGIRTEPVRYLEIAGDPPEGRIGVAENAPAVTFQPPVHANGATALIDCLLCVPDDALPDVQRRYEHYLGRPAEPSGPALRFTLATATVTIAAASALPELLPGEPPPPAPPAFAGCTVTVDDLARTEHHLQTAAVPHTRHRPGTLTVPAAATGGVAVTFRPAP